jgi:hypothetical protein
MLPGEEMKTIRGAWLLLLIPPLLAARPAVPASPDQDIVEGKQIILAAEPHPAEGHP